MRTSVILGVGSVLVLAGAYFASKLLVGDVAPPPVASVVSPPPDVMQPVFAPPPQRPQSATREQLEAAMAARRQGALQTVNANPNPGFPRLADPNPAPAAADPAPSPFQGVSKELDYAELLLAEPNPDPERLRSAHDVLARCVEQEPTNQRCQAGLALAKTRLFPPAATERKPPNPTLQTEPPHLLRPALQPK